MIGTAPHLSSHPTTTCDVDGGALSARSQTHYRLGDLSASAVRNTLSHVELSAGPHDVIPRPTAYIVGKAESDRARGTFDDDGTRHHLVAY